jgi:hypothetical protein
MTCNTVRVALLASALLALAIAPRPARAAKLSAADAAWIGKCESQLSKENARAKTVHKYCVCIHEMFDDNEDVSQSDMEHTFPPAHRMCMKTAGRK